MTVSTSGGAEPERYPEDRARAATIRSKVMLEIASTLVETAGWEHQQARVDLRRQGATDWAVSLFGSDGADAVEDVLSGRTQVAIMNPATAITAALRRCGAEDGSLAALATIPSYDQLAFAVRGDLGLNTLEELARERTPLRLSLRGGRPNHMVHPVLTDVLEAVGLTLGDIESWGGTVSYDEGLPHTHARLDALRAGKIDAIFDEGAYNWVEEAAHAGAKFLAVGDETVAALAELGYRTGVLTAERYPALPANVRTVDFSGFLLYTRSDTPSDVVTAVCEAMLASRERIPWQGGRTLPLEQMVVDAQDAPLPLPMHSAAEATWRAHGLLNRSG